MRLRSAYEDFFQRTLGALPGWWRKLTYVAGLRNAKGEYSHWGLSRTHGDDQAGRAMEKAHREVFLQVLRTPLRDLEQELKSHEEEGQGDAAGLEQAPEKLAPADPGGGSARHLSSIVSALSALLGRKRGPRPR